MQWFHAIFLGWFLATGSLVQAKQAAFAVPDRFAAEVAERVLKQGGTAVDAAVAVGFSLAVTFPEAGNLGGGGFMTLWQEGEAKFLDYREKAPKAASRDMYLDAQGQVMANASLTGAKASGVPGTVMGLWTAHQAHGKLPWKTLLAPAIHLAKEGFVVSEDLAKNAQLFRGWIQSRTGEENFEEYFSGLTAGNTFKQPELAITLERIAEQGAQGFYQGKTAKALLQTMQDYDGLITQADLEAYTAQWRQPIEFDWQGYQLITAPPPSSGGIALAQLLGMKQVLNTRFEGVKFNSPQYIHLLAEIEKRVYADRAEYLGDSDFIPVPKRELIAPAYLIQRANQVRHHTPSPMIHVKPGLYESPQTTHFSIVDFEGNAVSNTYTLNMPFGNGLVVEGAGFLLNNEMDDFSAKPGSPNVFGVIGGQANAIAPEKRMLSSMTPTLLIKDQQVKAVVGTPGGSTIITSVAQTLINAIEWKMSAQQAVDAPRVHHQGWPINEIGFNPDLPASVKKDLEGRGYLPKYKAYQGDVQFLFKPHKDWQAASDVRGRGVAKVLPAKPPHN